MERTRIAAWLALAVVALASAACARGLARPEAPPRDASRATPAGAFDVRDAGALGDGVADDTRAIQAAIDAARDSGGGVVYAPPGTYVIRSLRMYGKITIKGAGRDVTTFKAKPGMTSADRLIDTRDDSDPGNDLVYDGVVLFWNGYGAAPLEQIAFRDLTIDGDHASQTVAGAKNLWCIYLNNVRYASIHNVLVTKCMNHGIALKESTYALIDDVITSVNGQGYLVGGSGGGDGVVLFSRCHDNVVQNSVAFGNRSIGFEDEGRFGRYREGNRNRGNVWRNLRAEGNGDHGFLVLFADDALLENVTSVGDAAGRHSAGIQLVGTRRARVAGARIVRPGHGGLAARPECHNEPPRGPCRNDGGRNGTNEALTVLGLEVVDAGGVPLRLEDVRGARIEGRIRGARGREAVELGAGGQWPVRDVELAIEHEDAPPAASPSP